MRKWFFLRVIVFAFVCIVGLQLLSAVLVNPNEDGGKMKWIPDFYKTPENSLDAVIIGSSAAYCAWIPPVGWEHYGFTVSFFASPGQPLEASLYEIKECRKTQPDALYIVSLNGIYDFEIPATRIHFLTDYLKWTKNRLECIRDLSKMGNFTRDELLAFYLPTLRYHSRWSELDADDFDFSQDSMKGAPSSHTFLRDSMDLTEKTMTVSSASPVSSSLLNNLNDLYRYLDDEGVRILFITIPQALDKKELEYIRYVKTVTEEHGYPVLDLMELTDEIGLDLSGDFRNTHHFNIHGALKITDYLANYLQKEYGFTDKRGNPAFSDWDKAYAEYSALIAPYTVIYEREGEALDGALDAPKLEGLEADGSSLALNWQKVKGADGYGVFKHGNDGDWELLGCVKAKQNSYEDIGLNPSEVYTYTVAAYRLDSAGNRHWGSCDSTGVRGSAKPDAPADTRLSVDNEGNVALAWKGSDNAVRYEIRRRIPGQPWEKIGSTDQTAFTDIQAPDNAPSQYSVRSVEIWDEKEYRSEYSRFPARVPDLNGPELTAELSADGAPILYWESASWVDSYRIDRKIAGEQDFGRLAEELPPSADSFTDLTAEEGIRYVYRVTAVFKSGGVTYRFRSIISPPPASNRLMTIAQPEILFAGQEDDGVLVTWKPMERAFAFRVLRCNMREDIWETIAASETNTYFIDKPEEAGVYVYAVIPLCSVDGIVYVGTSSQSRTAPVSFSSD